MRVVYTDLAYANLDSILSSLLLENPNIAFALAGSIDRVVARVAAFPKIGPEVALGNDVRVVTLTRYPYRVFYRVRPDVIEILHIRHTSRAPWEGVR